jgi:hypothetical protein
MPWSLTLHDAAKLLLKLRVAVEGALQGIPRRRLRRHLRRREWRLSAALLLQQHRQKPARHRSALAAERAAKRHVEESHF